MIGVRPLLAALLLSGAAAQPIPVRTPLPAMPQGWAGWFRVDGGSLAANNADVFTLDQGTLMRRDTGGGSIKAWSKQGDLKGTPIPAGQNVNVQHGTSSVRDFDRRSLNLLWTRDLDTAPLALNAAGPFLLVTQPRQVVALDPQTGKTRWTVKGVDAEHQPSGPRLIAGTVLISHDPREMFEGVVFTAHDFQTGRQLWRAHLGHIFPLAVIGQHAFFDTRQWDNLLGDGGTFPLAQVNMRTGQRADSVRSLAGLPGKLALWRVALGTTAIDPAGTLWLVVQASDGGGTRLVSVDAQNRMRLRALPGSRAVPAESDLYRLGLTSDGATVVSPGGQVSTLRTDTGKMTTVTLPWRGLLTQFTPLGRWLGLTSTWGTVVLDEHGRIRYRAQGAGPPVVSGPKILMPFAGGIVGFPLK